MIQAQERYFVGYLGQVEDSDNAVAVIHCEICTVMLWGFSDREVLNASRLSQAELYQDH